MSFVSGVIGALLVVGGLITAHAPSAPSAHHNAVTAARIAARSVPDAQRWLRQRADVRSVRIGVDGQTLDIRFRDGRQIAILPAGTKLTPVTPQQRPADATGQGRAIVLEPFSTLLDGQAEVDALREAGFAVTELAGGDVTIPVMQTLASYDVVYIQTHSGALPDGDAVIATGETDAQPYTSFITDHTMLQVVIAGDQNSPLYNAITGKFVTAHMGTFPAGSIAFMNGCATLDAPLFWSALQGKGMASLIGWSGKPYTTDGTRAGTVVMNDLATGNTIANVAAGAVHDGTGIGGPGNTARLGYTGLGDETLANALNETLPADATPDPSSSPYQLPWPCPAKGRWICAE